MQLPIVIGTSSDVSPVSFVMENTMNLDDDHTDVYLVLRPSVFAYKRLRML